MVHYGYFRSYCVCWWCFARPAPTLYGHSEHNGNCPHAVFPLCTLSITCVWVKIEAILRMDTDREFWLHGLYRITCNFQRPKSHNINTCIYTRHRHSRLEYVRLAHACYSTQFWTRLLYYHGLIFIRVQYPLSLSPSLPAC